MILIIKNIFFLGGVCARLTSTFFFSLIHPEQRHIYGRARGGIEYHQDAFFLLVFFNYNIGCLKKNAGFKSAINLNYLF
jgi:hypothetical protein